MKKILFLAVSLFAMFAVSCTNDDIEIEKIGRKFKLIYNVSTQSMYDTFGLTNDIRENYLRDQSLCIGVTSFLYDSNGNLVDKKFSSLFTFNTVTEEFEDLLEGDYTVVTVETLVDPEDDFNAEDWSFVDEKKLSTLKIRQDDHYVYRTSVLGVCSANVSISSSDQTINVTPNAIGTLVEIHTDNFEKSPYAYVGFATNDVIEAYKLDPNLSREDRYVHDLTTSGYINVRGYLSAEDSENYYQTLYLLESSVDWRFSFVKQENVSEGIWTTYNANKGSATLEDGAKYYGGFWYKNEFSAPECYFGNYEGYQSWRQELLDAANSKVTITLPYTTWGATVANVSSSMNGYSQTVGSTAKAVLQQDGSYKIAYAGKTSESQIEYYFMNETSGLFESDLWFDSSKVGEDALLNFMDENYTYLYDYAGSYMYVTKDYGTYVILFEAGDSWVLGFVDVSYMASSKVYEIISSMKGRQMYAPKNLVGTENFLDVIDVSKMRALMTPKK